MLEYLFFLLKIVKTSYYIIYLLTLGKFPIMSHLHIFYAICLISLKTDKIDGKTFEWKRKPVFYALLSCLFLAIFIASFDSKHQD